MDGPKIIPIAFLVLAVAWAAAQNPAPTPGSFLQTAPVQTSEPQTRTNIYYELQKAEFEAERIQREIDQSKVAAESSVFSKDVSFYASGVWSTDPSNEYLTFTLNSSHQGKVLVTGFEIKSTITGRGTTIPKGVELPFAGQINEESPVFISPGDSVVLITGRSPIGYSFKLNKCTGYFGQFQNFTPWLPQECPLASDHDIASAPGYFNDACLDYLQTIPRCTMPLSNIPTAYLQSQCQNFIAEKLNYKSCVEEHKNDRDFYKKEWRVYLGQSEELWKSKREVIKLLDLNKKTIGTITY